MRRVPWCLSRMPLEIQQGLDGDVVDAGEQIYDKGASQKGRSDG